MALDVTKELIDIQVQVEVLKKEYPDFDIYITVSKEFNDLLTTHLGTEEYKIRLEELYGCKYQVSPFVDKYNWIVGLFDYSQILWQWNTFQDKIYKLSHLFTYATSDGEEKTSGEQNISD